MLCTNLPLLYTSFTTPLSLSASLRILSSKQLCWDNSYYCLLSFMVDFHIQCDLLITALRTSKGHLSHPISITVSEHESLQEKKKEKNIPLHHRWLEVAHDWRENGSVLTSNQQQPTKYQHTVQTHAYDLRNIRCCVKIWIYIKHHLLFGECIIRMMFNIAMIMEMPNIKAWLGNHSNPVMKC